MKKFILGLLTFIVITANAQILSPTIQVNPKISTTKLALIDSVVNQYVKNRWLIGTSVIVVKDHQVVYYKGLGYADEKTKKPMAANALYRIMSQSKAITSLAIMQLYEQGKLDLNDKLSKFFPSFKNPKVINEYNAKDTSYTTINAKREITIRDLLTHSSGIDYTDIGSSKMSAIYNKAMIPSGLGYFDANLVERMSALGNLPLAHQPGEKFTYGLNSDLLGAVVEKVSGISLEAYFNKNIFEPLGMKDTYFNVPTSKADRMPTVYTEIDQNIIEWPDNHRKINSDYPLKNNTYFSGGAGLSSTAFDYAIFLEMLLNKGKYNGLQILSPRTVEVMLSRQLDFQKDGDDYFSLGFSVTSAKTAERNLRSEGSFSWGGYYGTNYWADPKEKMIVLIMTQHTPNAHGDIKSKIEQIIYGSLL